jgi:hypothetical protein
MKFFCDPKFLLTRAIVDVYNLPKLGTQALQHESFTQEQGKPVLSIHPAQSLSVQPQIAH